MCSVCEVVLWGSYLGDAANPGVYCVLDTGGDLGGTGGRLPKFEVGDGPGIRPPQYFKNYLLLLDVRKSRLRTD